MGGGWEGPQEDAPAQGKGGAASEKAGKEGTASVGTKRPKDQD